MVRGENFSREADFLQKNRSEVLKAFLDDSHIQTAINWGLTPRRHREIAEEVAQMGAQEMKRFLRTYRSTPTKKQRGEMEDKRMLFMEVQMYALGQLSLSS